ncbi:MAG: tRNA (guanosine(46)-N7)-methyltransferase TrmB [Gammaproteobacteria bacterium]|nr:tRNA (guanosine(46)-N7)-methyltransferase TrmB [Gammaproteobacteria bacterium]
MNGLPMDENPRPDDKSAHRPVRSYVLRGGRLTDGQKRALDELWPRYGINGSEGFLDLRDLFGNPGPVILEIGFGDGDATWRMAQAHPRENYLGVEVHRPGVGRLLLMLERHGLENVRVACEDAVAFLEDRVPPASLDGVRIYFPDPWPKKRHHKRRLVNPLFVALLAGKLKAGGILHLATDWLPYAEHMLEVMRDAPDFENLSASGDYCPKPAWRPDTKYERRGERLGHPVRDLVFRRTAGRAGD